MAYFECPSYDSTVLSLPTPSEASGAIAQFNTDLTENLLSAVAEFSASQASGTPTPSAPIPIVGVDKVNVVCTGKNLANIFVDGKVPSTTTGALVNAGGARTDFIKCLSSEKYTLSCSNSQPLYVFCYDENKGFLNYASLTGTTLTVTTPLNAKYIMLRFGSNTVNNGMLEKGATATTFEPFGTTALINLGGTYYGGSVDAVTGKITKNYGYIEYDGSEDEVWSEQNGTYRIAAPSDWYFEDSQHSNVITCNMFIHDYRSQINNAIRRGQSNVVITSDAFTGLANFKQFISSTPIQVVYPLATPLVVYASNTAEIPTIVGDNQVYADTGDVAVKYFETVRSAI